MDGGISNPIPVEEAMHRGCDKNIVIITRERGYKKEKEQGAGLAGVLLHRYPKFKTLLERRAEEYNIAHQKILEMEQRGDIFLIAPQHTKGWTRTERNPEKLQEMYDHGVKEMKHRLADLKIYLQGEKQ